MQQPIEVLWKDGQRGSWCQAIVEWLTVDYVHKIDSPVSRVRGEGAVIVVKADQIKSIEELNQYVATLKWLLLIVTANEDGTWQWDRFRHPNSLVWLQTPHKMQHAHRYLPWGWTPGCSVQVHSKKLNDWFFAGQDTHKRRHDCIEVLGPLAYSGHYVGTDGFAKGLPQADYCREMAKARVVPCPSGPVTVDSLRVCEALQLGAIPVLDAASPTGPYFEYWRRVFGPHHPLPIVREWSDFPSTLERYLSDWGDQSEDISQWWQIYKEALRLALKDDLRELGAK